MTTHTMVQMVDRGRRVGVWAEEGIPRAVGECWFQAGKETKHVQKEDACSDRSWRGMHKRPPFHRPSVCR